jgi:hypothetical protein
MILFNTSFHVSLTIEKEWVKFLDEIEFQNKYVFNELKILKVTSENNNDSNTYTFKSTQKLNSFICKEQKNLLQIIKNNFGDNVIAFSTKLDLVKII